MTNFIARITNLFMPPNPDVQRRLERGAAVSHAEARLTLAGAEPSPRPPVGSEGPCCPLCNYHGLGKLNTGDVRCGRCGAQFPGNDIRAATAGQSAVQVARVGFRDLDRPLMLAMCGGGGEVR